MSAVVDVGDALQLTFTTSPLATVKVTWINPAQVALIDMQDVAESPIASGKYPYTFLPSSAGVWTAQFTASGTATSVERYYVRATALTGPPPLAAVGDVAGQYGSMTPAEENLASVLLRAASQMIRARKPSIDQLIADGKVNGDLVALAAANMVLRVLRNPGGLRSETVGPFTRAYDTSVAAGLLVLSTDEEALLEPSATAQNGVIGSFSPRASLAIVPINRRGGWPDGWW